MQDTPLFYALMIKKTIISSKSDRNMLKYNHKKQFDFGVSG